MPYAILASSLPQAKLAIYMELFNIFIVVPQLLVATVMVSIMQAFFPGAPIWTMALAAAPLLLAAAAILPLVPLFPAGSPTSFLLSLTFPISIAFHGPTLTS